MVLWSPFHNKSVFHPNLCAVEFPSVCVAISSSMSRHFDDYTISFLKKG